MKDENTENRPTLDDLVKMKRELEKARVEPSYAIFYDPERAEFVMQSLEDYSETILQEVSRSQTKEG